VGGENSILVESMAKNQKTVTIFDENDDSIRGDILHLIVEVPSSFFLSHFFSCD
jgi:hypothetical protein